MAKILITVPTREEINPLINSLPGVVGECENKYISDDCMILITGIGIAATVYEITKQISQEKPELILNIGIAGTADENIQIGDVVEVVEDEFADFGVVKDDFIDAKKCGFVEESIFGTAKLINTTDNNFGLKKTTGRTVHTIDYTGDRLFANSSFQVESMEGAAFFYVCLKEHLNFCQIRSISNHVGDGNKENWQINLAIKNLNKELIRILKL